VSLYLLFNLIISVILRLDKENWKIQTLPLARVKKIMKAEEFVLQELEKDRLAAAQGQAAAATAAPASTPDPAAATASSSNPVIKFMISAEAPVLMGRACEILIKELTVRAWRHTERNRRRTLQKQDVHAAVSESDVYDFLIDICPRVALTNSTTTTEGNATAASANPDQAAAAAAATMAAVLAQHPGMIPFASGGGVVMAAPPAAEAAATSPPADQDLHQQQLSFNLATAMRDHFVHGAALPEADTAGTDDALLLRPE
jgi:Core histone H2A/H2B/H3/H4